MDRQQAIRIIEDTFKNSFDEGRFTHFVRNLFNEINEDKAFTMAGNYIPDAYKDHVKLYKRIATYTDPADNELDIIVVNLKKDSSIERARSMQRNFLAWYLKNRGEKDAALVAYYTEGVEDWRFSYVRMEYRTEKNEKGKIKAVTDLTPARRYSFLVGKHEPNHTAQQQLVPLLEDINNNPTLEQIEQAFNIESVTKEFFNKYRLLFDDVNDHIEKELKKSKQLREELAAKGIDSVSFTKKLLGQIVFLYFIQKKGWLGVPKDQTWGKGDRQFLRTLLQEAISAKKNFYSEYLEFLFYEALATEHRGGSDASYYPKFDCKIPFLNGGLFEADYDWKKLEISLTNTYFTNSNKTEEGDVGNGILDVFDRYNFTVKEDEPLEKEVAVDPEMLGKVFENLLEVKDRKSKGAFYTPREIVHYMCQESLINYLDVTLNSQPASYTKLGDSQTDAFGNKAMKGQLTIEQENVEIKVPRTDIEEFIRHGIEAVENDTQVETKGKETQSYSYKIPTTIRENAKGIDKALEEIRICDPAIGSGAFPVGMMTEIVQARHILKTYTKRKNSIYDLKRHAIQECIYGVDIEHSAIDIAKLRLWLSLVVDEEDFYKIKPLPNLDYKIVQGNSLIGLPYVSQRMETLEKLKEQFFDETNTKEKFNLRVKINREITEILRGMSKQTKYEISFDFKLFFSEVFRQKNGFDVVIGNPPYISSKDLPEKRAYTHFVTAVNQYDTYSLFVEKSIILLTNRGINSLIVPDSILARSAFSVVRKYILERTTIMSVLHLNRVFDEANVSSCIYVTLKGQAPINSKFILRKASDVRQWQSNQDEKYELQQHSILKRKEYKILAITLGQEKVLDKIMQHKGMEQVCFLWRGEEIGKKASIVLNEEADNTIELITGENVARYLLKGNKRFIKKKNVDKPIENYEKKKIVIRQLGECINATLDKKGRITTQSVYNAIVKETVDEEYILAILNSRVVDFIYNCLYAEKQEFPRILLENLKELPIPDVESVEQKSISRLVNELLLKKRNINENTKVLEYGIDKLVYKVYGLTKEEIAIVEGK